MSITYLPVDHQSPGGFDNDRITERRPVLFQHGMPRYGPLFYWAWAKAPEGGFIDEHPHQGFEIVSYVLEGTIEHQDSLGTWKALNRGDVQVMQTNSGVSHSERFVDTVPTEMFQIWFEPNLREALTKPPTYTDYPASSFTWNNAGGNRVKHILGDGAPAPLRTDAHFHEILLQPKGSLKLKKDNVHVVIVAISGDGEVIMGEEKITLHKGDAAVVTLGVNEEFRTRALDTGFGYAQVMVPVKVGYALYPEM